MNKTIGTVNTVSDGSDGYIPYTECTGGGEGDGSILGTDREELAKLLGFTKSLRDVDVGAILPEAEPHEFWANGDEEYDVTVQGKSCFLFSTDWNWLMRVVKELFSADWGYTDEALDIQDSMLRTFEENKPSECYALSLKLLAFYKSQEVEGVEGDEGNEGDGGRCQLLPISNNGQ